MSFKRKLKKATENNELNTATLVAPILLISKNVETDFIKLKSSVNCNEDNDKLMNVIIGSYKSLSNPNVNKTVFSRLYPLEDFENRDLGIELETCALNIQINLLEEGIDYPHFSSVYSSSGEFNSEIEPIFKEFDFENDGTKRYFLYYCLPITLDGFKKDVDKMLDKVYNFNDINTEAIVLTLKEIYQLDGELMILPLVLSGDMVESINFYHEYIDELNLEDKVTFSKLKTK